jgi:hypothetical protein
MLGLRRFDSISALAYIVILLGHTACGATTESSPSATFEDTPAAGASGGGNPGDSNGGSRGQNMVGTRQVGNIAARPDSVDHSAKRVDGSIRLIGETDHSDASVVLEPLGMATKTDASGHLHFEAIAQGEYTLRVTRGDHQEVVPRFIVDANGAGVPHEQTLIALNPLEVPRMRRMLSDPMAHANSVQTKPQWGIGELVLGWRLSGERLLLQGPCDEACSGEATAGARRYFLATLSDVAVPLLGPLPKISPRGTLALQGERVVYMTEAGAGPNKSGVFHLATTSGEAPELLQFPAKRLAISPDSDWAAVVRADNGIERVDLKSAARSELVPAGPLEPSRLQFSQTAKALIYYGGETDFRGALNIVPFDGGGVKLIDPQADASEPPLISNDGKHIFYARLEEARRRAIYTSSTATPKPLKLSEYAVMGTFSPDHSLFYFARNTSPGLGTLHAYTLKTGAIVDVAESLCMRENLYPFRLVGEHLFFVDQCDAKTGRGSLLRRTANGGENIVLHKAATLPVAYWLTKDLILFQMSEGASSNTTGALYEVYRDGSGLRQLSSSAAIGDVRFSKDESRLFYRSFDPAIAAVGPLVMHTPGGAAVRLVENVWSYRLSADESSAVALADFTMGSSGTLVAVDLETHKTSNLETARIEPYSYGFTPDDNGILYITYTGSALRGTFKLALDGKQHVLGSNVVATGIRYAQKAGRALFIDYNAQSELKMASLSDGVVTKLGEGCDEFAVSPEQSGVAFRCSTEDVAGERLGTLGVAKFDTGVVRTLMNRVHTLGFANEFVTAARRSSPLGHAYQDGFYAQKL